MVDDYGFEVYENSEFPLAYLITFRTYGTWLHGDERHSVDRHGRNVYGAPKLEPNQGLSDSMKDEQKFPPVILNERQCEAVELAIRELCEQRSYFLYAINVRSNHVHTVVAAQQKPEQLADAFKAFATKRLREKDMIKEELQAWSRGRSRRYLWKPRHVELAINYGNNILDSPSYSSR